MDDKIIDNKEVELLPRIVYQMCVHGALLCGSYAKKLMGEVETSGDYDLIVPYDKWATVALLIPRDSAELNSFGGIRFTDKHGNQIDVWQGDPMTYLYECRTKYGGKVYVIDYINNRVFSSQTIEL